jgi:hypothetical protein
MRLQLQKTIASPILSPEFWLLSPAQNPLKTQKSNQIKPNQAMLHHVLYHENFAVFQNRII